MWSRTTVLPVLVVILPTKEITVATVTSADLRLADLLAQHDLGLQLVTRASTQVRIRGAHAIEIAGPSRWLKRGWLMLTVGTRFADPRTPPGAARELIRELDEAGISALAFGVDVLLEEVPHELVREANRRAFPIVTVPYEVPFLKITEFVNKSVLSTNMYLLRRTISMQDHLIESLTAQHPEQALVDRLGRLLKGAIVLYDTGGDILASTGPGPVAAIWREINSRPPEAQQFQVGRWFVASTPITADGSVQWLAIASSGGGVSEDLVQETLPVAERLLGAISHSREVTRLEKRLRGGEILGNILDNVTAEAGTWDRLVGLGFPRHAPVRVLAMAPQPGLDVAADEPGEEGVIPRALEIAAAELHLPLLLTRRPPRLAGMCPADDARIDAMLERVGSLVRVGLSAPFDDLADGPQAFRDAELALSAAQRRSVRAPRLRFEEVDFAEWLLAGRPPEQVAAKAQRVLGPVADNPLLVEALVAYLRCDLDVHRTAEALHLHPNSVRYRLHRAEQLLGHTLRSPDSITNLYLALHEHLQ
ncbi:MAG: PucR family transcriptional regulator [Streptosporangiales bacterium]|nr:PucR family transcriptional regulator [Streptosporangiales bacterium]